MYRGNWHIMRRALSEDHRKVDTHAGSLGGAYEHLGRQGCKEHLRRQGYEPFKFDSLLAHIP
jgi:hypothetical protein